ncbi:MAG TPA: HEAT repeat domain-containing protein, partial [Polyangia bacterium]|nr:HEAT repeat domain-containing protein [Polyangia bacterium]
ERAPLVTAFLLLVAAGAGAAAWRWHHLKAPPAAPAGAAITDYGALRAQAQQTLRAALQQPLAPVRVLGADALGKLRDQPSLPVLSELAERDPDAEVRGHSAAALGALGDLTVAPRLAKLEEAAPPPLKVWFAAALARLGDAHAAGRLAGYAGAPDLAVAFPAGLLLADVSAPGDAAAMAALKKLAGRESELVRRDPMAPVTLAMKLAALRDAGARQYLVGLLQHPNEGARLAAAQALAKLGDGAGRALLATIVADPASPDRLVAALAEIPLGERGGAPVLAQAARDPAPENRRLAARGLGELGDRQNLPALVGLASDPDWTVRVVAARAVVEIVGLDPLWLARAAVDWTRSALDSQDLAVRRAAAGSLASVPAGDALPLLARAILDRDPAVRRNAARSAGKMKSAAAAAQIAEATTRETDPTVKEQQVRALGEIGTAGGAPARQTLARLSTEPGRLGVLAAGSLIAAGDASGKAKLDAAVTAPNPELRAAAVEAAGLAHDPIVVPTLRLGLGDRLFQVRLLAAEGLSLFDSDKQAAVPILAEGLSSDDAGVLSRAIAGLVRFGDRLKEMVQASSALLDSPDPARRMAAAPIARVLPVGDASAVLHRMVADLDRDVRRAAADAIGDVRDPDLAVALYRPLLGDADPGLRALAAGQLARLVPPVPGQPAGVETPPPPTTAPPAAPPAAVQQAAAVERSAVETLEARRPPLDQLLGELAQATAQPARDDASLDRVRALRNKLEQEVARIDAAAADVERDLSAVRAAAGPSPAASSTALVTEADGLASRARDSARALRARAEGGARRAGEYVSEWTGDAQLDIDAANAKVAVGDLSGAQRLLDRAARQLHKSHANSPVLDYAYAQLFERMADDAASAEARRALLDRALDAYRRVSRGGGRLRDVADGKVARLTEQLSTPAQP